MSETHLVELEALQVVDGSWMRRLRVDRRRENFGVAGERRLGLAIRVDDAAQFLEWAEEEERIEEEAEELTDGDLLIEDQVQHQQQDRRADEVDGGPLHEAETADVADFLELELQDLAGRRVESVDLLLGKTEALHQLDVAQGFGGCARKRGCLGDDDFLDRLDAPAE